jgi:hypothetical protein
MTQIDLNLRDVLSEIMKGFNEDQEGDLIVQQVERV